jgi:hypothetical protein
LKKLTSTLSHNTGISMALALVAAGALWTFAQDKGRFEANSAEMRSRLERLEAQGAIRDGMSNAMDKRLGAIEAKLDIALKHMGIGIAADENPRPRALATDVP